MSSKIEPKFYAVDALDAYPEPVGTDDKLELNQEMGAVYVHLNYKRAKLVGLQSLDYLIKNLDLIRVEALGPRVAAPVVERQGDASPGFTEWFRDHGKEAMQHELSVEDLMEGAYGAGVKAERAKRQREPVATVVDFGHKEGWIAQGIVLQWCAGVKQEDHVGAKLYSHPAEQPAPSSVLNERLAAILLSLRTNAKPELFAPGQLAEVDACLDKVKELN
jgi:hypothetical protein